MKLFDFLRREKRESSFTDVLVQTIVSNSGGKTVANPISTGAVETCAGLWSRAFASAVVKSDREVIAMQITPSLLSMTGRALVRDGEFVALIDIDSVGNLQLFPVSTHNVRGDHDPTSWEYELTMQGPSRTRSEYKASSNEVVHIRYSQDVNRPWKGISPIEYANLTGKLSANLLQTLANEANAPHGYLLPVPGANGDDDSTTKLRSDLNKMSGDLVTVEDQSTMGVMPAQQSNQGWQAKRVGASPPESLNTLQDIATREVLSVHGVPQSVVNPSDATSAREGWRQFLHGTIAPIGRIVAQELSAKLETKIELDWRELQASDVQGRARAYSSLVTAGMSSDDAMRLTGFE